MTTARISIAAENPICGRRGIVANNGMELSHDDLDELLGIWGPDRVKVGKPLSPPSGRRAGPRSGFGTKVTAHCTDP
jgi:hypothetical protein